MKKLIMSRKAGYARLGRSQAFGGEKAVFFFILLLTLIFISGCNFSQPISKTLPNSNQTANLNQPTKTSINFLVSTEERLKYCNGDVMDSEGFRKTITKTLVRDVTPASLSSAELIKQAIIAASEQENLTDVIAVENDFLRIINDTAYLRPIDGWAGVSIFLCAWKPLVEVNLLYLANIQKVVWVEDLQKWGELK